MITTVFWFCVNAAVGTVLGLIDRAKRRAKKQARYRRSVERLSADFCQERK